MERHMHAQEVVASEDVAEERRGAADLAGVLA